MIISWLPVLVCLVGLLAYALSTNPKIQECGRIAYFCGLLAVCLLLAGRTVRLL